MNAPTLYRVKDGPYAQMTGVIVARDGGTVTLLLTSSHTELRLPAFQVEPTTGRATTITVTAQRRALEAREAA